jgi:protein phosphatase
MKYTERVCIDDDRQFLAALPVRTEKVIGSDRFYLVHAMPSDPLFGYCPADSDLWREQVRAVDADFLVVGHTHTPFIRKEGRTTIVNPGSIGQPKTGRPLACYAVWQEGSAVLKEYEYPLQDTADAIRQMPLTSDAQEALISVLQNGEIPPEFAEEYRHLQERYGN